VKKFKVSIVLFIIGLLFIASAVMAQENPMLKKEFHKKESTSRNLPAEQTQQPIQPIIIGPTISYMEGTVNLGQNPANEKMPLNPGDVVVTGENGRAEIFFGDGNLVRMDKNTELNLISFKKEFVALEILKGRIFVRSAEEIISVQNKGSVQQFRNSSYDISANEIGLISQVPSGKPDNDFSRFNICRDQESDIRTVVATTQLGTTSSSAQAAEPNPVENQSTESPTTIPNDLKEKLDQWGEIKENVDGYAEVWVPDANKIQENWKPYEKGEWRAYYNNSLYWNSYEDWNYCYHYGWWQWNSLFGWYWIYGRIWGPAWVNWYGYTGYYCPMWHDYGYYNRYYNQLYANTGCRGWSVVRRDQLRNTNISQTLASTNVRIVNIQANQLRANSNPAILANANTRQNTDISTVQSRSTVKSYPGSSLRANNSQPKANVKQKVPGQYQSPWGDLRVVSRSSTTTRNTTSSPTRVSPQTRTSGSTRTTSSRPTTVRSTGARRPTTAARTSAPRTTAPRGGVVRRK